MTTDTQLTEKHMSTLTKLDTFTRAYIECALWSSTTDGVHPLDDDFDESDIAPETLEQMAADCLAFQTDNGSDLAACELSVERQGHDFWLTRNRHDAGFWDHGHMGEIANVALDRLTNASHTYGSFDLYVGDDGMIHGS